MNGVCRSPGVCVCDEGWTGEDCSQGQLYWATKDESNSEISCTIEIQVCQVPCGDNGVCNVDTGNCDCSPGYSGAPCEGSHTLCSLNKQLSIVCFEDVPDCDIDNGNCEQICTNFIGGYNCSCKEGFLLFEEGLLTCNGIMSVIYILVRW